MASQINPGEGKNSKVTVVAALHDLQNEQVHKRTDEQYPTKIWRIQYQQSLRATIWTKKYNVMRKSIRKGVQVLHREREEELHLRYFIISFSKTRTQLGLFQVLQRENKSFFILSVREEKSQRVSNKNEQNKYILYEDVCFNNEKITVNFCAV